MRHETQYLDADIWRDERTAVRQDHQQRALDVGENAGKVCRQKDLTFSQQRFGHRTVLAFAETGEFLGTEGTIDKTVPHHLS